MAPQQSQPRSITRDRPDGDAHTSDHAVQSFDLNVLLGGPASPANE
jgi:hypothetical protein